MATFLLTWNPDRYDWDEYSDDVQTLRRVKEVKSRWSAGGTQQITEGDRVFMLRQHKDPRGIVGSGVADSDWYWDEHWEAARRGEKMTYVDVRFDHLVDIEQHPSDVLSVGELADLVPALQTGIQRSGTRIDDDLVIAVEQLWQPDRRLAMQRTDEFPAVTHADVIDAIRYFESHGYPPTFAPSTDFDLIYKDRHYPPKVIAGLAVRRARGRLMFSQEFRGGLNTPCFKLLQHAGFEILPKQQRAIPFRIGSAYTRRQIQKLIGLPETDGGDWATGHHREGNDTFIFATIGAPGRTGHQYDNYWVGDLFHWETKGSLSQSASPVATMLKPPGDGRVYIFTREDDRAPFIFEGIGHPIEVHGDKPVQIVWELESRGHVAPPGEVPKGTRYVEGATREVTVLVHERDPAARRRCIAHHGCRCVVCGMDFTHAYGEAGAGFIHVHHLQPLADGEREGEAEKDLRPVCPNCHAMLHTSDPPLSIEDLIQRINRTGWLAVVQQHCRP